MRVGISLLLLWITLSLSGCDSPKNIALSEKAAGEFHTNYDAGNFPIIYANAHTALRSHHSESEMTSLLTFVKEGLGPVKSTSRSGAQAFSGTSGVQVILNYDTQFERGTGTEKFTYTISNGRANLVSWHVNSPQLTGTPGK
jgi:hypothetical protein